MDIVDLQLHEPSPLADWRGVGVEVRRTALTEMLLQSMEAIGVTAAALHPAVEFDWAEDLSVRYPGSFTTVGMCFTRPAPGSTVVWPTFSPDDPDAADQVTALAERPGWGALRIFVPPTTYTHKTNDFEKFRHGGYDAVMKACEDAGIPVMIHIADGVVELPAVVERFPDLQFIVDQYASQQPPGTQLDDYWQNFSHLLALASNENVALKLCGAPSMSKQSYPFADSWGFVEQLFEAFGSGRLAWGSDISRVRGRVGWAVEYPEAHGGYVGLHTYAESLNFFLLSEQLSSDEKADVLGRTARRLLNWPVEGERVSRAPMA